jgi:hypothetical protein
MATKNVKVTMWEPKLFRETATGDLLRQHLGGLTLIKITPVTVDGRTMNARHKGGHFTYYFGSEDYVYRGFDAWQKIRVKKET